MRKLKQKISIFILAALGTIASVSDAKAQLPVFVDTGTVIADMPLKDINGVTTHLYDYLDSGYTVVMELFLTTCEICWEMRKDGLFEDMYKKYGPSGSVTPKKMMPMMIELGADNTNTADMHGTGKNTMGDWTKDVSYPIIDLNPNNELAVLQRLYRPSAPGTMHVVNTPTFLIICPDRKLIFAQEGVSAVSEPILVNLMKGRCAAGKKPTTPTGLNELIRKTSVHIYPNPGKNLIHVNVEALSAAPATFDVTNILGQTFISEAVSLTQGEQTVPVNIDQLSAGIYILSIKSEKGMMIQEIFVVEK